jgi:hypothetical protein
MIKINMIIIISITITICSSIIQTYDENIKNELIPNGKPIFWDPYVTYSDKVKGIGMYIISDTTLIEYNYDDSMRRKAFDYGDFMIDTIRWKLSNDTMYIGGNKGSYGIYKILKLKNDSLEVLDCKGNAIRSQMLFVKSKDQHTPLKSKY